VAQGQESKKNGGSRSGRRRHAAAGSRRLNGPVRHLKALRLT
jgi:hypothetical protein